MRTLTFAGFWRRWQLAAVTLALFGMLASATTIVSYGFGTSPGVRAAAAEPTVAYRPPPEYPAKCAKIWWKWVCDPGAKPPPVNAFPATAQEMGHGSPIRRRA